MAGVECGQFLGAVADDGYAFSLQVLECESQIENRLGSGTDDHHGGHGQFLEVGADVHGGFGTAVHAADAAGGKHLDARHGGNNHSRGYGGGSVLATGDEHGQVTA